MSYLTRTAGRPWRGGLAVALAAACLFALTAAAPTLAADGYFCPTSGYITIGAGNSCTNSTAVRLTEIRYYNSNLPWHCASANLLADGSGFDVFTETCSYGAVGSGEVTSGFYATGAYAYARGRNADGRSYGSFYGRRWWIP